MIFFFFLQCNWKHLSVTGVSTNTFLHLAHILVTSLVFVHDRDAHLVIGEEDEKKTEEDDKISSDPKYV